MSDRPTSAWNKSIRVLVVDDHRLLRRALVHLLRFEADFDVIGEAADGRDAVQLARELLPDLVIMDISMPDLDGIEATRRIAAKQPETRILGLSMEVETETTRAMRSAGAHGLLAKDVANEVLIAACRRSVGR